MNSSNTFVIAFLFTVATAQRKLPGLVGLLPGKRGALGAKSWTSYWSGGGGCLRIARSCDVVSAGSLSGQSRAPDHVIFLMDKSMA